MPNTVTEPRKVKLLAWCGLGSLLLVYAWSNRFVQDDAFISFRYARHLAEGLGLVWNPGERVEGYTNFLWTVCMAPSFILKIDIVSWCYGVSLTAFTVTLLVTRWLALVWWKSERMAWIAVLWLGLNFSFSSYATGGLETQFVTMWVLLGIAGLQSGRWVGAVLASACAVMTRMDAVLLLLPFWLFVLWQFLRGGRTRRESFHFVAALMLGALPVVVWLLWRHNYYGAWVPNTFLVKRNGPTFLRGVYLLGLFYCVYGLVLAFPFVLRQWRMVFDSAMLYSALAAWGLWHAYIIVVGGDFMEFRMLAPVLPLTILFLTRALTMTAVTSWGQRMMQGLLAVLICCGVLSGRSERYPMLDSIPLLKKCYVEWRGLAFELNDLLGDARREVKIGIVCAGIIPFYTDMPTLDVLGLNDRDVALNGVPIQPAKWFGTRAGHTLIASWEMAQAKGVHLLLSLPWVVAADDEALSWSAHDLAAYWYLYDRGAKKPRVAPARVPFMPGTSAPSVIAWPLKDGRYWLTIYLQQHPVIDAAIRRSGARVIH